MLGVPFVSLQNGVGSLAALKSLETLYLRGCASRDKKSLSPFAFDCPPIDLSCHSLLIRLALVNIGPESISVFSCCTVYVQLIGSYISNHPVRSAFCTDALRSILWLDKSSRVLIETPQDIPRALREASCLDCVHIVLKQWSCEVLPSALARVSVLKIVSQRIMLCVPAKVQWQCLVLWGPAQLDVAFEDMSAFVKASMTFDFLSRKPFGRSWLPLDAAMVQSKPEWVPMAKQVKYRRECADERNCSCSRDDIHMLEYEHSPGMLWEVMRCTCAACIKCLRRIGSV